MNRILLYIRNFNKLNNLYLCASAVKKTFLAIPWGRVVRINSNQEMQKEK